MPSVGFKPTIPVFEQAETFHALDRTATVIGSVYYFLFAPTYDVGFLFNSPYMFSLHFYRYHQKCITNF
jgi:hypothetical protein